MPFMRAALKVLNVHETDRCSSQQTDDCRAQDSEDASSDLVVLVLDDDVRDPYHDYERQPYYGDSSKDAAEDSEEMGRSDSLD